MGWGEARVAKREVEVQPGQVVVVLDVAHAADVAGVLRDNQRPRERMDDRTRQRIADALDDAR